MIIYYFIDFILAKLFRGLVNLSVIFSPGKSLYFDESFARDGVKHRIYKEELQGFRFRI